MRTQECPTLSDLQRETDLLHSAAFDAANSIDERRGLSERNSNPETFKPGFVVFGLVLFIVCLATYPLVPAEYHPAHRCSAMLLLVMFLWITEAVPFFVVSRTSDEMKK